MSTFSLRGSTPTASDVASRPRDGAVDLIRALALVRVIVFHASGNLVMLTLAPAMPVMFYLGGRYAALSLDRRGPRDVLTDRARRLLPPTLVYVVVVGLALVAGDHRPVDVVASIGHSIVPVGGPHDAMADWYFSTLWYLRDYLVAVAISPILLRALRTSPRATVVAMVATLVVSFGLDVGSLTAMYLAFWLLGMNGAHRRAFTHGGDLPAGFEVAAGVALLVAGGALLATSGVPSANAAGNLAAGLGFLLLLGAGIDPVTRVAARPSVALAASWVQQRAVSTYLWHMLPVIALFHLAGIDGRSLESAGQALWIIPMAVIATFAIAAVMAPIEHAATRNE